MARPAGCPGQVAFDRVALERGEHRGTGVVVDSLDLVDGHGVRNYLDPYAPDAVNLAFDEATWVSDVIEPGFTFTELIPTWHAETPDGSWVELAARARSTARHTWSPWLVVARWADHDTVVRPTSVPGESGDGARVATDTFLVPGADAWQLRVSLLRPTRYRSSHGPKLTYLAGLASAPAAGITTAPGPASGRVLDVAPLSQRIHAGHYPRWGGGGEAWCSPTSVAMVLGFWGVRPDSAALAWIEPSYPDHEVYHAVRHCWDHAYHGAGNWSFNAAYAAGFGLGSFVTRLRDLGEAEAFIAAGIPLVASLRVDPAELTGAGYTSAGHLVVVAGFTADGDVVVNDPGATSPETVRRVYRRAEFDHAWRSGSGRVVYVIHPRGVALPGRPDQPNW